ncbi:MAG: nucleoside-diphosphate-sugar epimerase [Planctomycetota bacterium]|jgi:nucleoside-diphosphate-sugar epimerase
MGTPPNTSTFLVTGALGCIGAWVVSRLLDRGDTPIVFDMGTDPRRIRDLVGEDALQRIRFVQGDIADPGALRACVEDHGVQRIIHLAGLQVPFCRADPMLGARVNVLGTVNVFEVAAKAGIDRVAYASSAAVYEREDEVRSQGAPDEDATPHPNSHYGVYKLANEGTARVSHMEYGISSMGLRPLTVYGVGRDQGMTSGPTKAIKSAVISQPYTIGFGGRTDFLFAGDCADAFIAAAERGPDGASVYNLAGAAVEVTAFASELISQVPAAADLIRVEGGELPVPGAIAGARLDDALPGLSRTSLTNGIADTLQRFRALHAAGTLSTSDLSS